MATNFPQLMQQQQQGSPLLGTLGSVAGGAIGTAVGGPLGGAAGQALGGQLAGQGTVNPMAAANSVLQSEAGQAGIQDPLKQAIAGWFNDGGKVPAKEEDTRPEIPIPEWTKKLKPKQQDDGDANALLDVVRMFFAHGGGVYAADGGSVWGKARQALGFTDRNKKLTGGNKPKSAQEMRKAAYKAGGGKIGHTPGDDGFMSAYETNKVGPLSGVKYKQTDGKVTQEYEKKFHNPLAPKPSAGGGDK